MWTRKELKDSAKVRMNVNYWKTVLAALIMMLILGNGARINFSFDNNSFKKAFNTGTTVATNPENLGEELSDAANEVIEALDEAGFDVEKLMNGDFDEEALETIGTGILALALPVFAIIFVAALLASVIAFCIKIFLRNPLEVGGRYFFITNHDTEASVSCYGRSFKNNYMNSVLIMFLRDLFIGLWSLLFVIPGIIKSYEYRMIPYLLADDPNMTREEAFAESKRLMTGNKWNAFVLDLSFIGWYILNGLTLGILGIFYVNPYKFQTDAELYMKLRYDAQRIDEAPSYDSYIEVK